MIIPDNIYLTIPLPPEIRTALADSVAQGHAIMEMSRRLTDLEITVAALTRIVDMLEKRIEIMQKLDPVATYLEKANVP